MYIYIYTHTPINTCQTKSCTSLFDAHLNKLLVTLVCGASLTGLPGFQHQPSCIDGILLKIKRKLTLYIQKQATFQHHQRTSTQNRYPLVD